MVREDCRKLNLSKVCENNYERISHLKWPTITMFPNTKAKYIYNIQISNHEILEHLNTCWNVNLENSDWNKNLMGLWHRIVEPNKSYLMWCFLYIKYLLKILMENLIYFIYTSVVKPFIISFFIIFLLNKYWGFWFILAPQF